jgi:hypothetical protein
VSIFRLGEKKSGKDLSAQRWVPHVPTYLGRRRVRKTGKEKRDRRGGERDQKVHCHGVLLLADT